MFWQRNSDLTVSAVLVQPPLKPETRSVLTVPLFSSPGGSQQPRSVPAALGEPALFPPHRLLQAEGLEQISQVILSETAGVLGGVSLT